MYRDWMYQGGIPIQGFLNSWLFGSLLLQHMAKGLPKTENPAALSSDLLDTTLGPGHPFQWKNTLPWHLGPAAKVRILRFKIFRHSGMILVFKTTFEVFTRVGPDNSLERLTERSVGLVTDQPSDVYELFVTLL